MAKYPQGITSFIPTYQPFDIDWNILWKNNQLKQTKYDKNWQQLNNIYSRLYNAQVSNPESIKRKNQLLDEIDFNVRRIAGLDLSLQSNVTQAKQIFKPFYQDRNLIADMVRTKEYNNAISQGTKYRTSTKKEERDMYWDGGIEYLQNRMEEFKALPYNELSSYGQFSYIPYADGDEEMQKIAKEMGNIKVMRRNGNYWVTTQNGELLRVPLQNRFQQALGNDPALKDRYKVEAYNQRKRAIRQNMSQGMDETQAEMKYLNENYAELLKYQTNQFDRIKTEKKSVQTKVYDLEEKLKNNPSAKTQGLLDQYKENLAILEALEKNTEAELELLQGNLKKTETGTSGSAIDPDDMEAIRYGVDANESRRLFNNAIMQTAQDMSMRNYEQTYKADEFAKIDYSNAKSIAAYQTKRYLKAAADNGYFPMLIKDAQGNPIYQEWADKNKEKREKEEKKKAEAQLKEDLKNKVKIEVTDETTGEKKIIDNPKLNQMQQLPVLGRTKGSPFENLLQQQEKWAEQAIQAPANDLVKNLKNWYDKGLLTSDELNYILGADANNGLQKAYAEQIKKERDSGIINAQIAQARMALMPYPEKELAAEGDFVLKSEEEKDAIVRSELANLSAIISNGSKDIPEVEYLLARYNAWTQANSGLAGVDEQVKLTPSIQDLTSLMQDATDLNTSIVEKRTERANAVIIKLSKDVGAPDDGIGRWWAPFMFVETPEGKRMATYEEFENQTAAFMNSVDDGSWDRQQSGHWTLEGAINAAAKTGTAGVMLGSPTGLGAVPGGIGGAISGFVGYTLVAGGRDLYNFIAGTPDEEKVLPGFQSVANKEEWYEFFNLAAGNSMKEEYDDMANLIKQYDEEQSIPVMPPGMNYIVDESAKTSGKGDFTTGANSITITPDATNTALYSQYLQNVRPLIQATSARLDDAKSETPISVLGVTNLDYEETEDQFNKDKLTELAKIILDDAAEVGLDKESPLKQLTVGISAISNDDFDKSALLLLPDGEYLDKALKMIYPDSNQADDRAKLKTAILDDTQTLAIEVPSSLVVDQPMYKKTFLSSAEQNLIEQKVRTYPYAADPRYSVTFSTEGDKAGSAMKVYYQYPIYLPNTGVYEMQFSVPTEAIIGNKQLEKIRENFFNVMVPENELRNLNNYQSSKPADGKQ